VGVSAKEFLHSVQMYAGSFAFAIADSRKVLTYGWLSPFIVSL
jgi:hypothetical protein